ncbi:MAG: type II CAAX endopeptidase family protein [Bacteroidota bacterium]
MRENVSVQSQILFFISRFLIFIGMVVFFYSAFSVFGMLFLKPLFGIDVMKDFSILSNISTDPKVLNAAKFLQVFISIGLFVVPAWFFPKAIQQDSATFLNIKSRFTFKDISFGLALMIISTPLISWLIYFNGSITFPDSMASIEHLLRAAEDSAAQLTQAFIKTDSFGGLLINIIVVALIPAFCEELLFRGALQQFFVMCFKNKHVAVWTTAIIFSAFHMQFFGFLPRLTLGVFLGYMFAYSGSLWVSVIAHFINNLLALLASYYKWNEGAIDFLKEDYIFPAYINVLSFILCVGIIYLMHFYQKKEEQIYEG